jgi:5-methylcytosine-specific restriction endonuclease McrA
VILIARDVEPAELHKIRIEELRRLSPIATASHPGSPSGEQIGKKYKEVASHLWRAQHFKCAFCEHKLQRGYNDVEHYRPKAEADRSPGCTEAHGYWWLAFTWSNLFFSCPTCNRSYKSTLFPLDKGSVSLQRGEAPPGKEVPLLLNTAEANGVEHIEFVFAVVTPTPAAKDKVSGWPLRKHWHPRARKGSTMGRETIRVCGLDDADHIEIYDNHVESEVRQAAADLKQKIDNKGDVPAAFERAIRLLRPIMPFVGLSYDALRALVPAASLAPFSLAWPEPRHVGAPQPRRAR